MVDAPGKLGLTRVVKALRSMGYRTYDLEVVCTHYGDMTARARSLLVAGRGSAGANLASIRMPLARRCPHGVKHALKDKLSEGDHHWLDDEGSATWDPAARGGSQTHG